MSTRPPPSGLHAWFCRTALRLFGWTPISDHPVPQAGVIVAAPHTSNWDSLVMLLAAGALGLRIRWAVKEEWGKGALGLLVKTFGGLPIRRTGGLGMTDLLAAAFAEEPDLLLAIAPSGTRKRTDHWRSGFYHVARAAQVPLICGVVDWGGKRAGTGDVVPVTGDMAADMDRLRAYYAGVQARFPEAQTPIRLKDEGGDPAE